MNFHFSRIYAHSGEITQEYDRHLGVVNIITFIDKNRRFVIMSDDKSLRVWGWYYFIICKELSSKNKID